jgi:hypothetical protein
MERLKFYADTPRGEKNKYFCFKINSILDLEGRLIYWLKKGMYIRSAWYESIDEETGLIQNQKIDLVKFVDERQVLFTTE